MSSITKVRKVWAKALLSGKYRQTQNALKDRDGFCCLGVLCDLYRKEVDGTWKKDEDGDWTFLKAHGTPPDAVQKWAGLTNTQMTRFVNMNDNLGLRFPVIAGEIEKMRPRPKTWANQYGSGKIGEKK